MTQPLTPVATTTTTTTAPVLSYAAAATVSAPAPNLSSGTQFWLSRMGTVLATLMGGWLIGKGWLTKDQSNTFTDWGAGAVVLLGGNLATANWSLFYRKLLELKPSHPAATAPLMADDVVQIVLATMARQASVAPTPAPLPVTPAASAVPTVVSLKANTSQDIVKGVLTGLEPRLTSLETRLKALEPAA